MEILEYDSVDPLGVLNLNLLSLDYALTPERVALIRRLDRRPFPFFALYAVVDGIVAGQVGVYSLPMVSTQRLENVGGLCAVCTHPAFSRQGIASRLFDEAHTRMRAAGLRYSTLGTARYRAAYQAYCKAGYTGVTTAAVTFARCDGVNTDTRLRAEPASAEGLRQADELFDRLTQGWLGFAQRFPGFIEIMAAIGDLNPEEVWLLWEEICLVGYALAQARESILRVDDLFLAMGEERAVSPLAAEAVATLAFATNATYLRVRINHPWVAESLRRAGYPPELPGWSSFMVKSLESGLSVDNFRAAFGVGTDRFRISPIDVT